MNPEETPLEYQADSDYILKKYAVAILSTIENINYVYIVDSGDEVSAVKNAFLLQAQEIMVDTLRLLNSEKEYNFNHVTHQKNLNKEFPNNLFDLKFYLSKMDYKIGIKEIL